jgi:hypothetical protein
VVTEYALPTAGDLVGIVAAADGHLWFTEYNANTIGKMTTAGVATEYEVPAGASGPHHVTAGPGGTVWFTADVANAIAALVVPMPTPTATATATVTPTVTPTPTPTVTATPPCGAPVDVPCRAPVAARRSQILLKDRSADANDFLSWKWTRGDATAKAEFGDPTSTTSYDLCVYDEQAGVPTLVLAAFIPAGGTCGSRPCWQETLHGFKFKDEAAHNQGIVAVALHEGLAGRAAVHVQGRGPALALPTLPLSQARSVRVQLRNSAGECWGAAFTSPALVATPAQFRDKSD